MRRLLLICNLSAFVAALCASPALFLGAASSITRLRSVADVPYTETGSIAHALGRIDGYDYTNSREAFIASYQAGFRIFEVDLMVTVDGQVVASHNANGMLAEFGVSKRVADMTMGEFVAQRYYGRYQPLAWSDLLDLLQRYPDTQLILDVKDRPGDPSATYATMHTVMTAQTRERDASLLARMTPYLYHQQDLHAVQEYQHVLYTLYRSDETTRDVVQFVSRTPSISGVEFGRDQVSLPLLYALHHRQIPTIMHTINDPAEAQALHHIGVDAIITDILAPCSAYGPIRLLHEAEPSQVCGLFSQHHPRRGRR